MFLSGLNAVYLFCFAFVKGKVYIWLATVFVRSSASGENIPLACSRTIPQRELSLVAASEMHLF